MAALPLCNSAETKASAINLIYRYTTLRTRTAEKLRRLECIAASIGVELPGLKERIADRDAEESAIEKTRPAHYSSGHGNQRRAGLGRELFTRCDLATPVGITVHQRFHSGDPPLSTVAFFREAIKRVPIGRKPSLLKLSMTSRIRSLLLRILLEAFPPEWKGRLSIRALSPRP